MREAPRFSSNVPVQLQNKSVDAHGTINNLSLNGAFVALPVATDLQSPLLTLKFSPPHCLRPLEVLALVTRSTADGIGVRFIDLDPDQRFSLWSSLAPLWPADLKECLYCGKELEAKGRKYCTWCQSPLDFQHETYMERLLAKSSPQEMIGTCTGMLQVFHLIRKVAATDFPVLVTGASGTGKEMVAQAIHQRSSRSQGPFVVVNCGAIPRELMESELFGHERGAFTGACRSTMGKAELAHEGTLFLDEIGELPLEMQVKLLRFLQEFTIERVGGRECKEVDVRVIAATNCSLKDMITAGRFREDLYYRLDVINIQLPSLMERQNDILIMANIFLRRYAAHSGKKIKGFSKKAEQTLLNHSWPGNVRELINLIRRAVVMAEDSWITPENMGLTPAVAKIEPSNGNGLGLKEAKDQFEANLVAQALMKHRGNVQLAAEALKTSRSVIYHLIQKHELQLH
jgi:transcriptional regulator with PAS, ATPase and Fis domain